MAGQGFDNGWNRRNQSYRNQPMMSSEMARGNQSFIKGRTFQRSRPNFNDKPTSTVSTSNMSYGMGDQGFNYPSGRTTGPQFKRPHPHQRNDNFGNMPSKSNTSYGMMGDSSYEADSYWTGEETGALSTESAGTAVGFYDYSYGMEGNSSHIPDSYWTEEETGALSTESAGVSVGFYDNPSRSRELPFSHPSQNDNDPALMSNMPHGMPQDVPTFFTGGSNNMAQQSRMPPSFRSSNPYSRHENFPSGPTEFSKSYPNQRNNNVIDTPYGTLNDPTMISPKDGPTKRELDSALHTLQQLACELRRSETTKSERSRMMNAITRLGLRSELTTHLTDYGSKCHLFIHGIYIASGIAYKKLEASRRSVFMAALHKLQMPYLRVIQINPNSKELLASMEPNFTNIPGPSEDPGSDPSSLAIRESMGQIASRYKEYSRESLLTTGYVNSLPLDKFIILAPKHGLLEKTAARTLKKSARTNNMLLENEYFFDAERVRCVVRIGNETLADEIGMTKAIAMNIASFKAIMNLREFCWLIKNKPISDSELWAVRRVVTRKEFGPISNSFMSGVNAQFQFKLKCVLENFVTAHTHEDMLFDNTFRKEERLLIHQMCREFGLLCKSTNSGNKTFVGVRRPLEMLFEHLQALGGQSFSHELYPPGHDVSFQCASSFYQEVSYDYGYEDYDDDDQTGPPFASQPNMGIPHFNRRKRRQFTRRNKYLNASNKPRRRRTRNRGKQASATGEQD